MSAAVDLEVLVVSYDSAAVLGACLASIEAAAPGTRIAIREHGTDVAARARLTELAAAHPAPVRIEDDPSNPGFGAGCNALARGSSARWLLFLNPDAEIVSWPWHGGATPPLDTVLGPRMVESGAPGTHSGIGYRVRDEIARSWLRHRGPPPDGRGFVSGAALLVGHAAFDRIGGFDEGYFLFYEDIDLCLRGNAIGIETRIEDRWAVRHAGAHSTNARFGRSLTWSYESAVRFHARFGHPVGAYRAYVVADSVVRAAGHLARRDRVKVDAYLALCRRSVRDLIHHRAAGRTPGTR